MISKDQLSAINDLDFSGEIEKMDDVQFKEYCIILDSFVEKYTVLEAELKRTFAARDYDSFYDLLSSTRSSLAKIYAKNLAQDCSKLFGEVGSARYEIVEAHFNYLSTSISALSIDLQMLQLKETAVNEADIKSIVVGTDLETEDDSNQKSILAVDDVSFLLNGLKSILVNSPYKFTGVTSGLAALKFIQSHSPDLFILDIEMPGMNGYELARKIREYGQKAPIIFLTGNSTKEYVLKAIEVGAADFIVKPFNKENVLEKIKKYIL